MIKSRTFRINSFTSLVASALVFFANLAIPAVLARTISVGDYSYYNIVISVLPFLLVSSFSLRSIAGSALIFINKNSSGASQLRAWFLIVATSLTIPFCIILCFIIVAHIGFVSNDETFLYWSYLGCTCLLIHIIGVTVSILISGPAAASHDFIPENLLKFGPGLTQLITLIIIYFWSPKPSLELAFLAFGFSSWPIAIILIVIYWRRVRGYFSAVNVDCRKCTISPYRFLFISMISMMWWHLSTWLATSASVATAAVVDPQKAIAFGMAYNIVGIISGGLIAVSSPVASKIASLSKRNSSAVVELFIKVNRMFYCYVLLMATLALSMPTQLYNYWVGSVYADDVRTFVHLLIPSTALRLVIIGYTLFVMGLSAQSKLWLSPFVEAVCAMSISMWLGNLFGIKGICYALVASAFLRLIVTLTFDRSITRNILPISLRNFI